MRVYLDNCCYNRPYDDQSQLRISLETQAKLRIQEMIRKKQIELSSSYVLLYENSKNPYLTRQSSIRKFVKENVSVYVGAEQADEIRILAGGIISTGVKVADAYHVACAIVSKSDCFLTTDDRLLKYKDERIRIEDPMDFIRKWEVFGDDD
ncbi:MAG: hypothetical protein K6A97_08645 [Lachnospiraceae bacterium]|nr:hypothetical protein [Lachnospiraceae bacterium]